MPSTRLAARHRAWRHVLYRRAHPPFALAAFGVALWLLMLPTGIAWLLDGRTVDGTQVWVKPLKFLASLGLFALTSAYALSQASVQARRGMTARFVLATIVTASVFELSYIAWQAAQGEASHFNKEDTFHALMYSLMGVGAVALTMTSGVLAWLVARHGAPCLHPVLQASIVLGLGLTVVLGIFTGAAMSTQPGHFVGHPPGGGTPPLLGWSLEGGDYRVAHFFGMHTQQALPLTGLLLARSRATPSLRSGIVILWMVAAGWTALVAVTFAQALSGLPFHDL